MTGPPKKNDPDHTEVSLEKEVKKSEKEDSTNASLVHFDGNGEAQGEDLIREVISHTGLPNDWVEKELNEIIENYGDETQSEDKNLTLDQLRAAMIAYLESLQAEFEKASGESSISQDAPEKAQGARGELLAPHFDPISKEDYSSQKH